MAPDAPRFVGLDQDHLCDITCLAARQQRQIEPLTQLRLGHRQRVLHPALEGEIVGSVHGQPDAGHLPPIVRCEPVLQLTQRRHHLAPQQRRGAILRVGGEAKAFTMIAAGHSRQRLVEHGPWWWHCRQPLNRRHHPRILVPIGVP